MYAYAPTFKFRVRDRTLTLLVQVRVLDRESEIINNNNIFIVIVLNNRETTTITCSITSKHITVDLHFIVICGKG